MTDLEFMQWILLAAAVCLMSYATYLHFKIKASDRAIEADRKAERQAAE